MSIDNPSGHIPGDEPVTPDSSAQRAPADDPEVQADRDAMREFVESKERFPGLADAIAKKLGVAARKGAQGLQAPQRGDPTGFLHSKLEDANANRVTSVTLEAGRSAFDGKSPAPVEAALVEYFQELGFKSQAEWREVDAWSEDGSIEGYKAIITFGENETTINILPHKFS